MLCFNVNTISILENNFDKVCWFPLSRNSKAIHLLEENLNKVNWMMLSKNTAAIHLLEQNQDKIDWKGLSANPSIFCWDYDYYKKRMDIHREELMKNVFHPRRLAYYLELGYDMFY